jgi:hypothetical protein
MHWALIVVAVVLAVNVSVVLVLYRAAPRDMRSDTARRRVRNT